MGRYQAAGWMVDGFMGRWIDGMPGCTGEGTGLREWLAIRCDVVNRRSDLPSGMPDTTQLLVLLMSATEA